MRWAWLMGALLASAALAQDGEALDPEVVILQAEVVAERHCADFFQQGSVVDERSAVLTIYAELEKLELTYRQSQRPELLYWRGALRQCINSATAEDDLRTFVEVAAADPALRALVDQARKRLRQYKGKDELRFGEAARWVDRPSPVQLELRYRAGIGLNPTLCGDDDQQGDPDQDLRAENQNCLGMGGEAAQPFVSLAVTSPALTLAIQPTDRAGLLVDFSVDPVRKLIGAANYRLGTRGDLLLAFRGRTSSGLRTDGKPIWSAWGAVGFAAGMTTLMPLAGDARFAFENGTLDPGELLLVHLGLGGRWGGAVELGSRSVTEFLGGGAVYVPWRGEDTPEFSGPAPATVQAYVPVADGAAEPQATSLEVERLPERTWTGGWRAEFAWRMLQVGPKRRAAAGLEIRGAAAGAHVGYPDAPSDVWCSDPSHTAESNCQNSDADKSSMQKVYTTHRFDVLVQAGFVVRFGMGGQGS